jgi:hypothetical protein
MLASKDIKNGSLSLTGVHGMVAKLSLVECMAMVEDPRVDRTKAHDLQDILVLSVFAVRLHPSLTFSLGGVEPYSPFLARLIS